ncbi:MAG TPA: asparagine--tRNA ligase [bacterium]|nr:asparagine--tRNA ligase [bacterium]HOC88126.1 asparagine--tRNA ligase [bacterium]HOZ20326.1 asparagine--tRNA ligase [bacterium]
MAAKVYIEEIAKYLGQEVTLQGWVYNKTAKGKLIFLMLRDGTGLIQAVMFRDTIGDELFESSLTLTQESSVRVTGTVCEDKRAKGGFELQVGTLEIVHIAGEYPISPKEHGIDFLMEHRHLWLRSALQHAVLKVRHEIISACRDYFDNLNFTLIDAPIFTPAAAEGTSTLFETNYFEDKAYLTQSGQLYMEAAAMAFGKVYCFGPTFRAEKSKTRRHLTEFWMIEPEVAFCDLQGDMELAEGLVCAIVERVLDKRKEELKRLERDLSKLECIQKPFPRLDYEEAARMIKAENSQFIYGDDLGAPDETIISQKYDRPVMVTHYPAGVKAFYMKRDPQRPDRALCVDLLAPEGYGEIIGGGQREDDLDTLLGRIREHQLPVENYDWYLDLRKYGSVPHAGFGLGLERTVTWICGLQHIRETIPFPRTISRIYP